MCQRRRRHHLIHRYQLRYRNTVRRHRHLPQME
jgi:hypothetical protein